MPLISILLSATRVLLPALYLVLASCDSPGKFWSDHQLKVIGSLSIANLQPLPAVPSNRFADNAEAAVFGRKLFFDKRLSANGAMSCADCHQPLRAFTDGLRNGQGVSTAGRNTQSLIGAAYQRWFYWDGRKDSLWSQALVPFESAKEMASSRVQVLRRIGRDPVLRRQYEALFGKFPSSVFNQNIAENAGPWGDYNTRDNWFRIPVSVQQQINSAYANIGKAVEAYERTLSIPKTKFDVYSEVLLSQGEQKAEEFIDEKEKAGLKLFIDQSRTHCLRCHNGPLFSNLDFHNIGSGNFAGKTLDLGRYPGIQAVLQDEFNCLGKYSDANSEDCDAIRFLPIEIHTDMQGAYKTPGLRYLDQTGPYFHDGRYTTLAQVIKHYSEIPSDASELPVLTLTEKESTQLQAFLEMLTSNRRTNLKN